MPGSWVLEDGGLRRDDQLEVLRRVLEGVGPEPDQVNRVLTVGLGGGLVFSEVPKAR